MGEGTTETAGTIRVLHVDDEPDFADLAATFLEREDERFEVETATSASDGLDRLDETTFDCVVSDYDMPHQNGIEFLEAVREHQPTIPFILFTGKGSEEIASEAISAGVSDYLQKGSGTERYSLLANRIENLVSQYRAESRLETRAEQQRRVAELGNEALAGASLETLFDRAVEAVADTLGNEYAKVLEYRPERDDLLVRAGVGWRDGLVGEATVGTGDDSQAGHTIRSEEPIVVDDLRTEERFRGPPLLVEHDVVSGVSVIVGSFDDPWGVLGTHTTEYTTFTDDDITFVQNVANVLANAIERRARERELERKDRAMDEAPVGITITGPARDDTPLTYVNDRFEELTGYDREEILGRNCRFLQGRETAEAPVAKIRDAIDADEPVTVELRNYRKDGTEFWNRVSIAPVYDASGSVSHYVGFQQDVTEDRRRRERRKRHRETLLELTTDDAVTAGDFENAARRITETAADVLDVPRVNVWLVDDEGGDEVFRCVDHYDRDADEHVRGMELDPGEYPTYVEALATYRTIDADDARRDPRTAELTDDYLDVHDIGALLDGTLRSEGEVVGVICHEQTGGTREWTDDEIEFVGNVADIVHRALRNRERRDHEQKLERTNALLSTLVETLPVGVLVEDASRDVLTVNERLFELFEMPGSPDEVVGADCERMAREVSDAFADPDRFVDRIDALIADGDPVRNEELSLRDGRTFARSYEPIELSGGNGHLWMYRDITEQKDRERERETTIEFLQSLYDVATDRTLDVNEKITRVLELGPEQLGLPSGYLTRIEVDEEARERGTQRVIEASGDHERLQPGESCPLSQSYCRKTIAGDDLVAIPDAVEAGWEGDPAYELFELGCYIGHRITVNGELYGTVFFAGETPRAEPFTAAERTFVRLMSKLVSYELEHDRTTSELKVQTERLEEQYRTLFEEAPVMAVLTRAEDGRPIIEDCNDQFAETVGYDHETLQGRDLAEFYTPDSREELLDGGGYRRALEAEFTREHRELRTADGGTVETLLRAVPRRDESGDVVGTLGMYVDITEREQVKRANERLEEFASIVSHDLRNPLNVAQGRLELAMEECESDHLADVRNALDRSEALIEDLLTLAREGSRVSDIVAVDVGAVSEKCWHTVATGEATIRIESDRTIRADGSRLQQLLENLYRNAIEHGGDDVTVTVGDLPDGFYVEDDGPGIPADERDDVLDPGYSTGEDGTGFGLSIVQQIAEAHGWEVGIAPGETGGARIEITGVEIASADA